MSSRIAAMTMLVVLGGCSCASDEVSSSVDGGVDSGPMLLPDGTEPFEPSIVYPGEGDACSFSLQCGERQLCVDLTCTRHERVSAAELTYGPAQRMSIDDVLATQLGTEAEGSWYDYRAVSPGVAVGEPLTWVFPGVDGPQLVLTTNKPDACRVAVVGARVRVVTVSGMVCHAAALAIDGRLAVGGESQPSGESRVVVFDRDDAVVFDTGIPESVHQALGQADGFGVGTRAGHVQSMMFLGDALWLTVIPGVLPAMTSYWNFITISPSLQSGGDRNELLAVLRISPEGEGVDLVSTGAAKTVAGRQGWLVQDGGVPRMLLVRGPGPRDVRTLQAVVRDLQSGTETVVAERFGNMTTYVQTTLNDWHWQRERHECGVMWFGPRGEVDRSGWNDLDPTCIDSSEYASGQISYYLYGLSASGSQYHRASVLGYDYLLVLAGTGFELRWFPGFIADYTSPPMPGDPMSASRYSSRLIRRFDKSFEIGWADVDENSDDPLVWIEKPMTTLTP